MKHIVTKKILPLLALMMIAMTSLCSAESWQLVAKEVGSDREYYADSDSSWYDGVINGGGLTKIRSKDSGFSAILTIRFLNKQDGSFDVLITNGKAYDPDGNLLYGADMSIEQFPKADMILSKICKVLMDTSTARK